jgi:hypothetical protein
MGRSLSSLLVLGTTLALLSCGPDRNDIVALENKKLNDLKPAEAAKVEEAMSRIRYESDVIARGGTLPAKVASGDFPHHIQLGSYTNAEEANIEAELWKGQQLKNVIVMEIPNASNEYRYVVRLSGFQGYRSAYAESQRLNNQFGIQSYPIQIRP